ncbi:TIGR02678 family protein [Streptomyces spectabilis]|uniref:TIGR02678 family protein n=1 Tax=Streptomyces spectabilis TaxID=68270 RepID=UPI0033D6393E
MAAERRLAARALLGRPVLLASTHCEVLSLVHRHAVPLQHMFQQQLGYSLFIEASFARLVKHTDAALAGPVRRVRLGLRVPVPAVVYPLVCLAVAALLAPGVGGQVLISRLVDQMRQDAVGVGVEVSVYGSGRQPLARALQVLMLWGVLEEQDGTIEEWNAHEAEGLLNIRRGLLPYLLTRPLPVEEGDVPKLWAAHAYPVQEPRQSLRRKLVENPVVRREDLSEAEREVLSRNRSEISRQLQENFGLGLEVRLEGLAAFDLEGSDTGLSDERFPGPGTVRQAALLLADALVAGAQPRGGCTAWLDGREVAGVSCAWRTVDQVLGTLVDRYSQVWAAKYVGNIPRLRREAVGLLEAMSLAASDKDGLVLYPAVGRYRPRTPDSASGGETR